MTRIVSMLPKIINSYTKRVLKARSRPPGVQLPWDTQKARRQDRRADEDQPKLAAMAVLGSDRADVARWGEMPENRPFAGAGWLMPEDAGGTLKERDS